MKDILKDLMKGLGYLGLFIIWAVGVVLLGYGSLLALRFVYRFMTS